MKCSNQIKVIGIKYIEKFSLEMHNTLSWLGTKTSSSGLSGTLYPFTDLLITSPLAPWPLATLHFLACTCRWDHVVVSFFLFFSVPMLLHSIELWWCLDCVSNFPSSLPSHIFLPFLYLPGQTCIARHLPLFCSKASLDGVPDRSTYPLDSVHFSIAKRLLMLSTQFGIHFSFLWVSNPS